MARAGKVYLIGAGPGDARLLTVGAAEALKKADVILYDRLVSRSVLAKAGRKAKRVYVGRAVGDESSHQDRTNEAMLRHALQGKTVARLKGGDPIMFGRGAEEAEYLESRGIRCSIIPGITSGLGSATYCGIPLTHRRLSSSVAFVTGHEDPAKRAESVKWRRLAKSVDTIVIVMGVSNLASICAKLADGGMDGSTPAAVIQDGTTPRQRQVYGTVSGIARAAKRAKIGPPAVVIVGKVAGMAKSWGTA